MKSLLPIVLLLLACETLPPDELVAESVVQVVIGESYVTGFFVDRHIVATVDHAIHNGETEALVKHQFGNGRAVRWDHGLIVHRDAVDDYALLFVRAAGVPVPVCHAHVGKPIRVYGWPDSFDLPGFRGGRVFTRWSNHYTTTAETTFGYSGGPVVYRDCVIAMHKGRTCIGTTHAIYNDWGGVFE